MLAKKYLLGKRAIARVFKKGRFARGKTLDLKYLQSRGLNNKYAIIVSKKVALKATARNKTKRRLSEIISKCVGIKKNYDIIVIARAEAKDRGILDFTNDFNNLIKNAGLL